MLKHVQSPWLFLVPQINESTPQEIRGHLIFAKGETSCGHQLYQTASQLLV